MLFSYLKRHYKLIILLAVFASVFALVFLLYGLPTEPVLYAGGLCLLLGLIAFFFGLWRYSVRHRRLRQLISIAELGVDRLPDPSGAVEEDYQELCRTLYGEMLEQRAQADSARRDMEDYCTLWAHQIKTPLAALRLLLENDRGENAEALRAELFKTEQYVDMVLQYVRLGSDSNDLVIRSCELDGLIRACLRKYARLFALKDLSFSFEETGLTVLTDEKWLSFVIEQVFSNSLKYTSSGRIDIFAEGQTLFIEDTGIGIRPEDLPRVCEKGYTGAGGRADKKSTGIGLFLCKKAMDMLGHGFTLTSSVGVGTKVAIDLSTVKSIYE